MFAYRCLVPCYMVATQSICCLSLLTFPLLVAVNLWGFKNAGKKQGYKHEHFVRGRPDLCHNIKRSTRKSVSQTRKDMGILRSVSSSELWNQHSTSWETERADNMRFESARLDFGVSKSSSSLSCKPSSAEFDLFDEDTLSAVLPASIFPFRAFDFIRGAEE